MKVEPHSENEVDEVGDDDEEKDDAKELEQPVRRKIWHPSRQFLDEWIPQLKNLQGHVDSQEINKLLIRLMLVLWRDEPTLSMRDLCLQVAELSGRSHNTLRTVLNQWYGLQPHVVPGADHDKRNKRRLVERANYFRKPHFDSIRALLKERLAAGTPTFLPDIAHHLSEVFGVVVLPHVLRYALKFKMHLVFGRTKGLSDSCSTVVICNDRHQDAEFRRAEVAGGTSHLLRQVRSCFEGGEGG